jgi:hypothetical protein
MREPIAGYPAGSSFSEVSVDYVGNCQKHFVLIHSHNESPWSTIFGVGNQIRSKRIVLP